jgi:membrane fusion protein (multidrug efflux system)
MMCAGRSSEWSKLVIRILCESCHSPSEQTIKVKMRQKIGWGALGILLVLPIAAGIFLIKAHQTRATAAAMSKMVFPPETVNAAEVRQEEWHPRISAVGTVASVQGTLVSAEADGIVRAIKFEAGSEVKAGDELVQLDVDIEQAQLRAAEASAEWAHLSFERTKELSASRTVSQADLDSASASNKQALAQVDNIRALIQKKTVRAPFGGKLGIRRISIGQFLQKGSPVVSLHSLDPIYVEFSLPQQRIGDLAEGLKVLALADAYPGREFEGTITAINPEIDLATRNVRVQATFPNREGRLRHGMFVSVEVVLASAEKLLFIPVTAVHHSTFGDSIFVIEQGPAAGNGASSLVAQQRFVHLGAHRGDFVAVTSGAKAGEKIVATGVFKLRPGTPVVIDNTLAPNFTFKPKPNKT